MKAWIGIGLAGVVIVVVLTVAVIQRLSAESMAVLIGGLAGVIASIPTSLIVVWFALRAATVRTETTSRAMAEARAVEARAAEPHIVVVNSGGMPAQQGYGPAVPMALPPYSQAAPRRFTMIGGAEGLPAASGETREEQWR